MKKKIVILLTLILFVPFVVNAKDWTVDWQKSWGGNGDDNFRDIFQTQDGGFIAYGDSYSTDIEGLPSNGSGEAIIVKFDIEGNVLWQKSWGGNDWDIFNKLLQTEDGGFIACGFFYSTDIEGLPNKGGQDAVIVKYDKNGKMLWQKSWGGSDRDEFQYVFQIQDGGFIAFGYSSSPDIEGLQNKGGQDAIIVKYDRDGNMLWQKSWGGNYNDYFRELLQIEDGGFIACGFLSSTDIEGLSNKGFTDAIIVKFDKEGNVIWQKSWGGNSNDSFYELLQTEDDGFIATASSISTDIEGFPNKGNYDVIILKYDKDGNMLWQKSWGGNGDDTFETLLQTLDGGFITYGYTDSTDIEGLSNRGYNDATIVKYDKDGNMLWQKSWAGSDSNIFSEIFETKDGGFIVSGYSTSIDIEGLPNKGYTDAIILKYDKDGNVVYQTNWGGIEGEGFTNILLTQDDGFIVSGFFGNESNQVLPTSFNQGVRIVPLNNSMPANVNGLPYKDNYEAVIVKYSIKYDLENTTTENGTSTIEQQGKYGIITPTPNEGYEVDKVIIKDKDGSVLDLVVTKQQDGTYTFELSDDVSVEVLFKKELVNPKTGLIDILLILFIGLAISLSGFLIVKRYNEIYEF